MFETEKKYDYVTVAGIQYSGKKRIDIIINATQFIVEFHSDKSTNDKGFELNWNCLKWKEWSSVGSGSCKKVRRPQPEYLGADKEKYIQYENMNKTCSKLVSLHSFSHDMIVIQQLSHRWRLGLRMLNCFCYFM